jgi:hypothetical protein
MEANFLASWSLPARGLGLEAAFRGTETAALDHFAIRSVRRFIFRAASIPSMSREKGDTNDLGRL